MTEAEQAIYDRMSPRQREAIDACSDALKPIAIRAWAAREFDRVRKAPAGYVPWNERPRRETLAPADFQPGDDSERRYP